MILTPKIAKRLSRIFSKREMLAGYYLILPKFTPHYAGTSIYEMTLMKAKLNLKKWHIFIKVDGNILKGGSFR